jgi:integrase
MPTVNLTERAVEKLKAPDPSNKQVLHWDKQLKGFGVLCSGTTNAKSYVVQRYLPGHKSPRRVTIAATSLKEARDKAARLLVEMREGKDPKAKKTAGATLKAALEEYLKARSSLAPRSRENYQRLADLHLKDWFDRELRSITPDDVEARYRRIAEEIEAAHREEARCAAERSTQRAKAAEAAGWPDAAAEHRARASAALSRKPASGHATSNAAARLLRALWNFQTDRDPTMPASPVRRLKRQWFKVYRREGYVKADEMAKFYAAVQALPNPVARDYLTLLLFTGLRRREAAALRWTDVDMAARTIKISAPGTKGKRTLDLPISDVVYNVLMERQRLGRETFIFPADAASGHLTEPKSHLAAIARATGIKVTCHDLRRTFTTNAEHAGISHLAITMLTGHAPPRDQTSGYKIMTTEELRAPAQRVANRLKKLCGVEPARAKNVVRLKTA